METNFFELITKYEDLKQSIEARNEAGTLNMGGDIDEQKLKVIEAYISFLRLLNNKNKEFTYTLLRKHADALTELMETSLGKESQEIGFIEKIKELY